MVAAFIVVEWNHIKPAPADGKGPDH